MEQIEKIQGTEKEFIKVFQELCYSRSSWQVWADLMAAMACTLANSVDKTEPRHTAREKEYAECIKRLGGVEKPAKCFAIVVEALERNPDQDFLGKLYMSLELGKLGYSADDPEVRYPVEVNASSSNGYADGCYTEDLEKAGDGQREVLGSGALGDGTLGGRRNASLNIGLGSSWWNCAARLSACGRCGRRAAA